MTGFGVYIWLGTFLRALQEIADALDIVLISDFIDGNTETATWELSWRIRQRGGYQRGAVSGQGSQSV